MYKKTAAILLTLVFAVFSMPLFAYWAEVEPPAAHTVETDAVTIGKWCYKCEAYSPDKHYKPGDIVGYTPDNGKTWHVIKVVQDKLPNRDLDPWRVDREGRRVTYNNDVWFQDLTNGYTTFNIYTEGDIVKHGNKLYVFSGDYHKQWWRRNHPCKQGKIHNPFVGQCWAKPGQRVTFGNIFWVEITTNDLTDTHKNNMWTQRQVYYKNDVVYTPRNDYTTRNRFGFIQSASLSAANLRKCVAVKDGDGFTGIQLDNTEYWQCEN